MADLSVTAANVVPQSGAEIKHGTAGEAVTAGQPAFFDATVRKWKKADNDSATAAARAATGMFVNSAALDQPVAIQVDGDVAMGAVLTANTPYFLSNTAGGICPIADVGTGEYLCEIGIAKSTTILSLTFKSTGVAN